MGNKVALAESVAQLVALTEPERPLVDLFGGMCSVAGAVSLSGRSVWVNDAQHYAGLVARCLVASKDLPPTRETAERLLIGPYRRNLRPLKRRFEEELDHEKQVLARDSFVQYRDAQESWQHVGNNERLAREAAHLRRHGQTGPYRLATLTFSWGYFGLRQCVEIDSLRAAINVARNGGDLTADEAAWCRLALLQTCSRVASTPGHFAQYLRGTSPRSYSRIQAARNRSVWEGFFSDLATLSPYGTRRWRSRNRVTTEDALTLWPTFDDVGLPPAVFYADPPYSKEQYSRFYHVLESLELYDYPTASGIGRYRPDRFTTMFSRKSGVLGATRSLCEVISEREGTLLLSYPSSGLLTAGLDVDVHALLGEYFSDVSLAISAGGQHSTLGGRHGQAHRRVTEYVWFAH